MYRLDDWSDIVVAAAKNILAMQPAAVKEGLKAQKIELFKKSEEYNTYFDNPTVWAGKKGKIWLYDGEWQCSPKSFFHHAQIQTEIVHRELMYGHGLVPLFCENGILTKVGGEVAPLDVGPLADCNTGRRALNGLVQSSGKNGFHEVMTYLANKQKHWGNYANSQIEELCLEKIGQTKGIIVLKDQMKALMPTAADNKKISQVQPSL